MNAYPLIRLVVAPAIALLALGPGCATKKNAVFVTKTSLALLEADTTPATVSIGYDRVEGYFGPAYSNGAAPPVVAIIESDGKVLNPKIRQLYATGNAAEIIGNRAHKVEERADLTGDKGIMFFGTSTNIGVKLTFMADQPVPTSIAFGYKRKEASFIPLGQIPGSNNDAYPSVIASIDTATTTSLASGVGMATSQVFATGVAADGLAPELKEVFKARVRSTIDEYKEQSQAQRNASGEILALYTALLPMNRLEMWKDADRLGLFHEGEGEKGSTLAALQQRFARAVDSSGSLKPALADAKFLFEADKFYTTALHFAAGTDAARLRLLEVHAATLNKLLASQK